MIGCDHVNYRQETGPLLDSLCFSCEDNRSWCCYFYCFWCFPIFLILLLLCFQASFGPPFALVQGTLEAHGTTFRKIPTEVCPFIRRGSVAWVGSGPEFFISLANHKEWKKTYTVFGYVLPEDMGIAEKIAQLPSKPDVWNNINVSVLEKPVPLWVRQMNKAHGSFNAKGNAEAAWLDFWSCFIHWVYWWWCISSFLFYNFCSHMF